MTLFECQNDFFEFGVFCDSSGYFSKKYECAYDDHKKWDAFESISHSLFGNWSIIILGMIILLAIKAKGKSEKRR